MLSLEPKKLKYSHQVLFVSWHLPTGEIKKKKKLNKKKKWLRTTKRKIKEKTE